MRHMSDDPYRLAELSSDEKALLVEMKTTCPFIGSVVAQGKLPVRNDAKNPLASIEDVRRLGNTGGGGLGGMRVVVARGNHALIGDDSGKVGRARPEGRVSLAV